METTIHKKIALYNFQDNLKTVYATPVGHLCLFTCFAFPQVTAVFTNPFAILSLIIAILFFIAIKLNNWESHQLNLCFLFVYLFLIILEWLFLGIPNSIIGYHQGGVSKGMLLEFAGGLMPLIYVGMRIFLIIPLILITISSFRLSKIGR